MGVTKTVVAMVGAFLFALTAGAAAVKINKTELPAAVRAAVDRHAPGAHIGACWRIAGDGEEMYEIDLKKDGIKKGFIVAADGKLLTIQEEVAWQDLPGEVQESLQRMARDNEIQEVYVITQHAEIAGYGARVDGPGLRVFNYQVGPHGEKFGADAASRVRQEWREPGPERKEERPQEPKHEPTPEPNQERPPEPNQ